MNDDLKYLIHLLKKFESSSHTHILQLNRKYSLFLIVGLCTVWFFGDLFGNFT